MTWLNLTLNIAREHADAYGDSLMALGAISVNVEDALEGTDTEKPIFGEPGASTGFWDLCRLTALFC